MAESTCLHIQDHDAGPIRIVEIPWISARIGRAAFCEVRLPDPSLPEEACRLHRRGRTWHLTPLHGSDVTLGGDPVEGPRPLPYDVAFRVGPFRLSLKQGKFAEPDWRPAADAPRAQPHPRPSAPPPVEPPAVEPAAPLSNPWEARWRDAGDRLKAARAAEARPAPAPPPPPAAPAPAPAAAAAGRPTPREAPRPAASPRAAGPREVPRPAAGRYEPPARPRTATPPAAPRYQPRAYARPTPPPSKRPAPPRPPAPEAWTRPVPTPAPPVVDSPTPIAEVPTPIAEPTPAPILVAEIPTPVVEVPTPIAEPAPAPAPAPPTRRFHFLDADALARLEDPDVVEAFQAVPEPPKPQALRRRLRRSVLDRRRPDEPAALILPEAVDDLPAALEGEGDRGPDEGATAVASREEARPAIVPTSDDLRSLIPSSDASDENDPASSLGNSPLPPGEGGRAAAGEGRRISEGVPDSPIEEPEASRQVRRPSPGPSGHPLPAGEGTTVPPPSIDDCDGAVVVEPEPLPAWTFPAGPFVADTNVFDFGSGPIDFEEPQPRRAVARAAEEDPEAFDPSRTRRSKGDEAWVLPSVQDVLNSGLRRARAEAAAIPRPPSRPARPAPATPTEAAAPAQWSLPAWVATPPALAATLAVGGLLAACSWRQATVSHAAAAVIRASADVRLAGAAAKDRPLPPGIVPPRASWWGAAPAHLAEWGVYLDGTKVEHGWDATAAGMFEAATAAGPLDPLARFALARTRGDAAPAAGLSRDAVALAWTGRTLHRAGKDAEAVRAYRRALEVAAKAEPPRDAPLAYSRDPNVPRYLLPGEDLAAAVVADLAADASWPYRDWAEAVPESGVSALAAARVLRQDGRPEAEAILKRIIERADADAKARAGGPEGTDGDPDDEGVALAVAAEAMAMRAEWKAAANRYRAAIDRMVDARVRRSWWFNLADVAAHANDDDQRRAALDEALASASSDEVSRRVLELRQGSAGQLRPKAN